MPIFRLDKLVTDARYKDMLSNGQRPDSRKLRGRELLEALGDKLLEEVKEYDVAKNKKERDKEWGDVEKVMKAMKIVAASSGEDHAFLGGHYVSTIELDIDDRWVDYFRANPIRFKELRDS